MSQDAEDLSRKVGRLHLDGFQHMDVSNISLESICTGIQQIIHPGLEMVSPGSWDLMESVLSDTEKNITSLQCPASHLRDAAEYLSTISEHFEEWAEDIRATSILDDTLNKKACDYTNGVNSCIVINRYHAIKRCAILASQIAESCHVKIANLARKLWEEQHPIEAAQEFELREYYQNLRSWLLESHGGKALNDIPTEHWTEAEKQVRSLEEYLKEHKIQAVRIRETKIDKLMVSLLKAFERLDETGINRQKVDVTQAERIWGLIDKLGSGVTYLVQVDARSRRDGFEPIPTTRSIFLLKSAPPANLQFSTSPAEWRAKRLCKFAADLNEIVVCSGIVASDEQQWNVVFQELSALEDLLISGITLTNVKDSKIDETLKSVSDTIQDVERTRDRGDEIDSSLMYASWEMALKISEYFVELET